MDITGARSFARIALAATLLLVASAAAADPVVWKAGEVTVEPLLSDRLRVEVVDWFDPGAAGGDESYAFVANVIRFGAVTKWRDVKVTLEGQEVELFGIPDDAPGLGPGAVYFASTAEKDQREVSVRRAVLEWSDAMVKGLGVAGGRYILNDGLEAVATDAGLQWLKKNRISQRLVGGFDYTHVGRSFDGASLRYARAPWNFTLAGGRPTAGGFNISANNEVEEVAIVYAALTATEPEWLPRSDGRLFYLHYVDERGLVATDNRDLALRQADTGDISIHTVGLNLEAVHRWGPGDLDLLVWAAGQGGQWESLDHAAWALSLEAGYRLVDVPTKPWLRAGWYRGSGDDDPDDGDHGTFFQVLPTARLYAQTPFYNMMNNEEVFLQLVMAPAEVVDLRIDWHHLWATESEDLVYAGGGATQTRPVFGFSGYSARGHSDVADLLDISVEYAAHPRLKIGAYYGHAFGGSAVDAQYPASGDLDYAYFEFTLKL